MAPMLIGFHSRPSHRLGVSSQAWDCDGDSVSMTTKDIDTAFLKAVAIDVLGAIAIGAVGFALLVIL